MIYKHKLRLIFLLPLLLTVGGMKGFGNQSSTEQSGSKYIDRKNNVGNKPNLDVTVEDKGQQLWCFNFFPENIQQEILQKPAIIHIIGHHYSSWTVIIRESGTYKIYNGTIGKLSTPEPTPEFDTTSFIRNNEQTLQWSFDSLSRLSRELYPVDKGNHTYIYGYEYMYVVSDGRIEFLHKGFVYDYLGAQWEIFNEDISKLHSLLMWLTLGLSRYGVPIPNDSRSWQPIPD